MFPYLFDDVVKGNELVVPEPYYLKRYYDEEIHLIQAFDLILNNKEDTELKPKFYLLEDEIVGGKTTVDDIRSNKKKPVVMLQAHSASFDKKTHNDNTRRSMSSSLLSAILEQIDAVFINFSTIPIQNEKVINLEIDVRKYISLVAFSDYCIGIDSCMSHIAAGFDKVGTFFYGPTNHKQLGYNRFMNISRAGYPKGHQSFRISSNPMLNHGAMDFTENEISEAISAIKNHMSKCGFNKENNHGPSELSFPRKLHGNSSSYAQQRDEVIDVHSECVHGQHESESGSESQHSSLLPNGGVQDHQNSDSANSSSNPCGG
jgi:hypothetical protein